MTWRRALIFSHPSATDAVDMAAINRLAASYSEAICRGEVEEAVLVYAEDGVLASGSTEDAVGRASIADMIRHHTKDFEFVFQTTHSGVVEVSGNTAWARTPLTEWSKLRDGRTLQFLGVYEDDLERRPEGWCFKRRFLHGLTIGWVDSFAK